MAVSIGEQLKEARNRLGWNQDQLGDQIHMSRQTISHWETGRKPVPAEYISILEEVLQCKFEIEQEQEEAIEEQATEIPVQEEIAAAKTEKNKLSAFLQKNVPAWLYAVIAGGIFIVMLVIMLCTTANLQKQIDALNKQPTVPYSLAWYQQIDEQQAGKAYVTIAADQNPVKGVSDPAGSDVNLWMYSIMLVERNGIDFTVTEISYQDFNANAPKGSETLNAEKLTEIWGSNVIPANGMQSIGSGMPVQEVSHRGVLIKGVDARGNELEFHGVINFSQEMTE